MKIYIIPLIVAGLTLSACGTTSGDRALSGAGIGAGTGAALGAVTGMGVGTGAVVGGAVGAAAGTLLDKDDVDLGKPVWR
jgi:surface antigen